MSPVTRLVYKQKQREGDFRFKHMQIRANAESAAFYHCGEIERAKTEDKFKRLLSTQRHLFVRQYALQFSMSMASYIGSILSYVILAIPIFGGKYDDKDSVGLAVVISENAFVTMYLIYSFTSLTELAITAADVAGNTHRIGYMLEYMESSSDMDDSNQEQTGTTETLCSESSTSIADVKVAFNIEDLTYGAPNAVRPLVNDITFKIVSGVNLLITGDSGCGKSSLLRVLDGLWPAMSGTVEKLLPFGTNGIIFLPQKPFLTDGTLRQQIIYPNQDKGEKDNDLLLMDYLRQTDLLSLFDRIGGLDVPLDWNWYDMLSPGETQRLSFARLFYHKPPFAVLDEATSQIGTDLEKDLYKICSDMKITVVSVGHRESLRNYHDMEVHLDAKGGWTFANIA